MLWELYLAEKINHMLEIDILINKPLAKEFRCPVG